MKGTFKQAGLKPLAWFALVAALALGIIEAGTAHARSIKIRPDMAKIVEVAGRPATVVVGNPLYAEVAVVGRKLLIQGRNYGETNIIVMDLDGNKLADFLVVVTGRPEEEIKLYKQGERYTYLCAPECSQTLDSSDSTRPLDTVSGGIKAREDLIKKYAGVK